MNMSIMNNPYIFAGTDPEYAEKHGDTLAVLALVYEQHMRNRIAYLTLANRDWYTGDDELDEYFGE